MAGYNPVGNLAELAEAQGVGYGMMAQFANAATVTQAYYCYGQGVTGVMTGTMTTAYTYKYNTNNWYVQPEMTSRDWYEYERTRRCYEREAYRQMLQTYNAVYDAVVNDIPVPGPVGDSPQKVTVAQARGRARALLLKFLSPAQRSDYEAHRRFDVLAGSGMCYRLYEGHPPQRMDNDRRRPTHSYCIHTYGVPREDELLGFKLMLEANEALFLQTANATPV